MKAWRVTSRNGKELGRILAHNEAEADRRARYSWPKEPFTLTEIKPAKVNP